MKLFFAAALIFCLLMSGCTGQGQKPYACSDGSAVSNQGECPKELKNCSGANQDYCGPGGLRYFNASCDRETGQYAFSNETCQDDCQDGKCIAIPLIQNTTEFEYKYLFGINCTRAKYYKERNEYTAKIEIRGFDDLGWCMFAYDYTPKNFTNTTLIAVPSYKPMNGTCSFFNKNESKNDQERINKYADCELDVMSIYVIELVYEGRENATNASVRK